MLEGYLLPGVPVALFWTFVGAAIVVQGISKSGFAGGAGILSLPLMMLVMPVDKVTASLLPLLILCDMNAIYHHRRNQVWAKIWEIYVPAVFGILLGAAVWWWVGEAGVQAYAPHIKRFVGVIAILFGCYILAKEASMRWVEEHKAGWKTAWSAGLFAGFSSTIAHAAGPVVSLFMYSQGLSKTLFVGTVAWTFTLINLTKLPFYVYVGLIDPGVLRFDLFLVPLIPIGSYMGHWMLLRVSEKLFTLIILVLSLLAGLQLVLNINVIQIALATIAGLGGAPK